MVCRSIHNVKVGWDFMVIRFLGKRLSSFQIIIAGFLGTILVGALLLMLPIAVRVW